MIPLAFSVHNFISSVGADAGFAAIVGLAILILLYFSHARETADLREEAARLTERLQQAEARVAQLTKANTGAPPEGGGGPGAGGGGPAGGGGAPPGGASATAPVASAPAASRARAPFAPAGTGAPALAAATRVVPAAAPAPNPTAARAPAPQPTVAPVSMRTPAKAAVVAASPVAAAAAPSQSTAAAPAGESTAPVPPPEGSTPPVPAPATAAGGNGAGHSPAGPPPTAPPPVASETGSSPPDGGTSSRPIVGDRSPLDRAGRGPRFGHALALGLGGLAVVAAVVVLVAVTSLGASKHTPNAPASNAPGRSHSNAAAAFKPSSVRVSVLNGTTTNQLAHRIGEKLAASGYKQGTIATAASQTDTATVVAYLPGAANRIDALHVATALGLRRSAVRPVDSSTLHVACPVSTSCSTNVVVTVGADLATL